MKKFSITKWIDNELKLNQDSLKELKAYLEKSKGILSLSAIGATRLGKSSGLNNMIKEISKIGTGIEEFKAGESINPITLGIEIIVIPWMSIKEKYQQILEKNYEKEIDLAFVDCEGTDYINEVYGEIQYLLCWLISSVTYINTSKIITDSCEKTIINTITRVQNFEMFEIFRSHIHILVRDVSKKSIPDSKLLLPVLKKRPKLENILDVFQLLSLQPIYTPDAYKREFIATSESVDYYASIVNCLKAGLEGDVKKKPFIFDADEWMNEINHRVISFEGKIKNSEEVDARIIDSYKKNFIEKIKRGLKKVFKGGPEKIPASARKPGIMLRELENVEEIANRYMNIIKFTPERKKKNKEVFKSLRKYLEEAVIQYEKAEKYINEIKEVKEAILKNRDELLKDRENYKRLSIAGSGLGVIGGITSFFFPTCWVNYIGCFCYFRDWWNYWSQ